MCACRATSSRLMFAPERVKAYFAISRMRVRLRCASARGFRGRAFGLFEDIRNFTCNRRQSPLIIFYGDILRLAITWVARQRAALRLLLKPEQEMTNVLGATSTADEVLFGVNLQGKRVLVTGVSAGIGVETARALAAHGAHVVGAARDLAKAESATDQVRKDVAGNGGGFELIELDLANLKSVRACADRLLAKGERFDGVIANAGVMATPFGHTADRFETQFGTNHLGHVVLVTRIASLIRDGGRLINLSSSGHRYSNVDLEDPNFERTTYDPFVAYGRSKTANILFAVAFDKRHRHH